MKILVTGAGGGLGGEVSQVFTDDELTSLDRTQLDITDAELTSEVVGSAKPDVVLHCAAYTAVDKAEEEDELAHRVNADGTRNVAAAAAKAGAIMIYPSTDYVFDGAQRTPYVETDPTNPLSVYGLTKLEGERAAQEANPKTYVLRTSWLYSQTGKSFVTTILKLIAERDELTVVADEISSPTYARDFARAIQRLLELRPEFGVYHAACGGETSWRDYAALIAKLDRKDPAVKPTTAEEYGLPAMRPPYSVLDCSKLANAGVTLPDWEASLANFFADRA
jgi:dTDP-4-dehydrorhamnose reductase